VRGGRLETRSYFDGDGDRERPYPEGALPEDGLPASLRDYVTVEPPASLTVFPALMTSRFASHEPRRYRVEKRPADGGVELRLTDGAAFLSYVFEAEAPHRLLRFERDDGTVYKLAKCDRLAYWEMAGPGQEAWLPERVR
jgi:hypothetical protein